LQSKVTGGKIEYVSVVSFKPKTLDINVPVDMAVVPTTTSNGGSLGAPDVTDSRQSSIVP
jgi:hypothetical protein